MCRLDPSAALWYFGAMSAGSSLGGMVKLENGSRKLADAEAKVAETQARLTGMYNKDVINAVHDELLTEQLGYRSPSEVRYPPPASVSVNEDAKNLVLLTAPTQNGKTNEMLALIWTGFFKYKLPSYVFLRSDATAYSDISDSVRNFNQKIVDFLLAKMDSQKLIGFDPEHYTLELSTLQASKKVNTDQVVTIPVNGRGRRFLKPIVRCRLLTAGNVERALGPDEIQAIAAEFGTTADGERLNLMVFVDEAQNTRQTLTGGTFKLEKNLFRSYYSHHRYGLLGAVHRWCTRHGLTGIVEPESLKKSLRRLAALYVEVSATPEATLLVESDSTAQHVQVKMWDNYYGFISSVSSKINVVPAFALILWPWPVNGSFQINGGFKSNQLLSRMFCQIPT